MVSAASTPWVVTTVPPTGGVEPVEGERRVGAGGGRAHLQPEPGAGVDRGGAQAETRAVDPGDDLLERAAADVDGVRTLAVTEVDRQGAARGDDGRGRGDRGGAGQPVCGGDPVDAEGERADHGGRGRVDGRGRAVGRGRGAVVPLGGRGQRVGGRSERRELGAHRGVRGQLVLRDVLAGDHGVLGQLLERHQAGDDLGRVESADESVDGHATWPPSVWSRRRWRSHGEQRAQGSGRSGASLPRTAPSSREPWVPAAISRADGGPTAAAGSPGRASRCPPG